MISRLLKLSGTILLLLLLIAGMTRLCEREGRRMLTNCMYKQERAGIMYLPGMMLIMPVKGNKDTGHLPVLRNRLSS